MVGRVSLYRLRSRAISRNLTVKKCRKLLARCLGYAALITDPEQQAEAYRRIALRLHERGDEKRARETLQRALAAAESIGDEDDRVEVLAAVAPALAQVMRDRDVEGTRWMVEAFRAARERGRGEVLVHIRHFAPVLAKLGVISAAWERMQAVELLTR